MLPAKACQTGEHWHALPRHAARLRRVGQLHALQAARKVLQLHNRGMRIAARQRLPQPPLRGRVPALLLVIMVLDFAVQIVRGPLKAPFVAMCLLCQPVASFLQKALTDLQAVNASWSRSFASTLLFCQLLRKMNIC